MFAAYPDRTGPATPHADAEDDALRTAAMHAEGIMREAETLAVYFDGRLDDIAQAPRQRTAGSVAEAETLMRLASDAAQALELLRRAVFGKRA